MTDTQKPKPRKELKRMSDKRLAQLGGKAFSTIQPTREPKRSSSRSSGTKTGRARTPIAKVGKQKAKRVAKNREYYASPEWRAKRKAVFERDGYQCTEVVAFERDAIPPFGAVGDSWVTKTSFARCPNRGEVVNGKQTARGLVAEETGYQHRGVEGAIDRIRTRCKDCDRRLTPQERVNHRYGFRPQGGDSR